jgi:hypothetical protein
MASDCQRRNKERKGGMMNFSLRETFFDVGNPVGDCTCHHTTENEVKPFGESPFFFHIVDFELDVWRDTVRRVGYQLKGVEGRWLTSSAELD